MVKSFASVRFTHLKGECNIMDLFGCEGLERHVECNNGSA